MPAAFEPSPHKSYRTIKEHIIMVCNRCQKKFKAISKFNRRCPKCDHAIYTERRGKNADPLHSASVHHTKY